MCYEKESEVTTILEANNATALLLKVCALGQLHALCPDEFNSGVASVICKEHGFSPFGMLINEP